MDRYECTLCGRARTPTKKTSRTSTLIFMTPATLLSKHMARKSLTKFVNSWVSTQRSNRHKTIGTGEQLDPPDLENEGWLASLGSVNCLPGDPRRAVEGESVVLLFLWFKYVNNRL